MLAKPDERFDRCRQRQAAGAFEKALQFADVVAFLDRGQRLLAIESPGSGLHRDRPVVEQQRFLGRQNTAHDVDVQPGCERQGDAAGHGGRLIGGLATQQVRAERCHPEGTEAVVAAQERQVVGAPHAAKVGARLFRMKVGDIHQAKRCRVLEQEGENVAILQDVPAARSIIAEAAVLTLAEIELPGVVGYRKDPIGRPHVPREIVKGHPPADRAHAQGVFDGCPPRSDGGHHPPLGVLSLDRVDAAELVEQRALQPLLPKPAQHLCRRQAKGLDTARAELQTARHANRQTAGLQQHRPGKCLDRADFLVPRVLLHFPGVVVATGQLVAEQAQGGGARQRRLVADLDARLLDGAQHDHHFLQGFALGQAHGQAFVFGQGIGAVDAGRRWRRHESLQAGAQVGRDDIATLIPRVLNEQAQGRALASGIAVRLRHSDAKSRCALVSGAKPPVGILAERVMRRFGDGSLLRLVKPRPDCRQFRTEHGDGDAFDQIVLARRRCAPRQVAHQVFQIRHGEGCQRVSQSNRHIQFPGH